VVQKFSHPHQGMDHPSTYAEKRLALVLAQLEPSLHSQDQPDWDDSHQEPFVAIAIFDLAIHNA
jgi:hypothetical protein